MTTETVPIPGGREVVATHASPEDATACVVACPPHPEFGGHRGDPRLRAVTDALQDDGIATLRFDYGAWDEGRGERADARNALRWATDRYDHVGCFGYSFGGAIAVLAAADADPEPDAVSVLAPTAHLSTDLDATTSLEAVTCPVQVVVGTRDETADWRPVAHRARDLGHEVVELEADHHFVGQHDRITEAVVPFLSTHLI
ncbi:MAG: CocE/NonD family hydrolase [Halobacteriaceae archaeon]